MSNHLFVNLTYAKDAPILRGSELLNRLRELALKTMLLIRDCGAHEGFETVCVSIFDIPREGENLRMYRTRMPSIRFENFGKQSFLTSVSGEETHLPELRPLLVQAPGSRDVT
jgi:hypothetical protein